MKVILRNSSLTFEKGLEVTNVVFEADGHYLSRTTFAVKNSETGKTSDFYSLDGVQRIEASGIKYGYDVAPYLYYDSQQQPISSGCDIYPPNATQITSLETLTGDLDLTQKPANAAYIRFSSQGGSPSASIYK